MGTSSIPKFGMARRPDLSDPNDPWLRAAILSSAPKHADQLLPLVIQKLPADETRATWVGHLVATIWLTSRRRDWLGSSMRSVVKLRVMPMRGSWLRWPTRCVCCVIAAYRSRNF